MTMNINLFYSFKFEAHQALVDELLPQHAQEKKNLESFPGIHNGLNAKYWKKFIQELPIRHYIPASVLPDLTAYIPKDPFSQITDFNLEEIQRLLTSFENMIDPAVFQAKLQDIIHQYKLVFITHPHGVLEIYTRRRDISKIKQQIIDALSPILFAPLFLYDRDWHMNDFSGQQSKAPDIKGICWVVNDQSPNLLAMTKESAQWFHQLYEFEPVPIK